MCSPRQLMHLSKLHSSLIMVAPRRTRRPCWYNILTSALKRYCCSSFTSPMPKIHVQFFLKVWLAFTLCTVIRVTVLLIFKDFWQKINPVAKGKEIAVKFTFANSPHSMPAVDHRYISITNRGNGSSLAQTHPPYSSMSLSNCQVLLTSFAWSCKYLF